MEDQNIPYVMLNRYGRRSLVAAQRKAPYLDRVWKIRKESDKVKRSRQLGLELRLERVRERTRLRKQLNK